MAARLFPLLQPSSRSYSPGRMPETRFESQNGATTIVSFGNTFVNAELRLEFSNISDTAAYEILAHYESVIQDDHVVFDGERGFGGIGTSLQAKLESGKEKLRWRYDGPPAITSVYPGVSSVSCSFIGYFYGA